jgi:hypothetical protein
LRNLLFFVNVEPTNHDAAGGRPDAVRPCGSGQKEMKTTPEQIFAILKAVRTKPAWPSAVEVPVLDSFNGHHQADKLKLFEELHAKGFLTRVPGATGVRTRVPT